MSLCERHLMEGHITAMPAVVGVLVRGDEWRLCACCAALPSFVRYTARRALKPHPSHLEG